MEQSLMRGDGAAHVDGAIEILPISGIPEIQPGDDIGAIIGDAIAGSIGALQDGDVVAVTQKIVSKAEGKLIHLPDITPSALATQIATEWEKDARQVEVVLRESKRIVRMVRGLIISQTKHGFICANAGVDASNVANETVCVLPDDADASAEGIRQSLMDKFFAGTDGADHPFGVIVTDSFGRPWRSGIVNVAIGVAGMAPLADYRGQFDPAGYELRASILAVADELASAAELVMHKLAARPVAVIRGYDVQAAGEPGTAQDLVMAEDRSLFN
jgi:coenzyme F420-0:L-glutamate ligase/coenzyme F420-1:gamma-L-glutamate ligase